MDILNRVEELIETQRSYRRIDSEDKVMWRIKVDKFSTKFVSKYTWNLVQQINIVKDWWKDVWFSVSMPKYAFHSWLAVLNRLSIGDRMQQ